ncbi:hypothetical protein OKA05_00715 [Luteolibacter arcticus]|uniref:Uncharacterized protein n=1 Tax=Luteolibacter arcticus TaxID=1581411 RepID=A0ABT3GDH6_9BACT|nr:hypothetical protein [Luteolibacter arcticus]MCW1921054.1 hypothetical protein [Luteolibacter arcticus]
MAKVTVNIRNFKGAYAHLNGEQSIEVSRRAILRASLTLGFQDYGGYLASKPRLRTHRYLSGLTALNCLNQVAGNWVLDDFFEDLDGSEKNPESYGHGMIFAKLVAERFLGVPWLAHVDDMKKKGLLKTTATTRERGDMGGRCNQGHWHVIEAKGRSSSYPSKVVEDAKHQAACVKSVTKKKPRTNSACIVSLWTDPIDVLLDDPPAEGATSWDFEESDFWKHYYGNLAAYIRDAPQEAPFPTIFEDYVFTSLSPFLEELSPEVRKAFSPLPEIIGLPRKIVSDPAAAGELFEGRPLEEFSQIAPDGVALLGPFGRVERLSRPEM